MFNCVFLRIFEIGVFSSQMQREIIINIFTMKGTFYTGLTQVELNHQLGESNMYFLWKLCATVSALHSVTAWTWSQSTNTSVQARRAQKSQLCTRRLERPWIISFTTRNAFPQVTTKVGATNSTAFAQISFRVTFNNVCLSFLFLLSRFYGYKNRLEVDWFSLPPLRRHLVVPEGASQSHVPLRSSQPSGKIPDGPERIMRW